MSVRSATSKQVVKGRLFLAEPGDVVYSKIDARNGAVGVVPQAVGRLGFSAEYPIYQVDPKALDPDFLHLVLRSDHFRRTLNGMASGTSGRKRIQPSDLERAQIPVPPLAVQRRIVAAATKAREQAARLRAEADAIEQRTKREFFQSLGLTSPSGGDTCPRHFVVQFRDIERWGVQHLWKTSHRLDPVGTRYAGARLGDVIQDLVNGWSPKCLDTPAAENEWGVLKVGAVSFGVFDPSENKALPPKLAPKPELEVKPGDFLISRANVTRLVGACALVRASRTRLMLCDKIFRAVWHTPSPVLPEFLDEVLKTPHVRQQIESALTGTSATMKNITKGNLLELRFPLPPIAVQRSTVATLTAARDTVHNLRTKASGVVSDAAYATEQLILGALQP